MHGPSTDTPRAYLQRLAGRVRFYPLLFLAPLYLAIPAFSSPYATGAFSGFRLLSSSSHSGTNFYTLLLPHYIAEVGPDRPVRAGSVVGTGALEQRLQIRGRPAGSRFRAAHPGDL